MSKSEITTKLFAIAFAVVMALSMVSMGAASIGAQTTTDDVDVQNFEDVEISTDLQDTADSNEVVEAIVRFDSIDVDALPTGNHDAVVGQLKSHADRTQERFKAWASQNDAVSVEGSLWITNAAVVKIRTSEVSLDDLADQPGVTRIHENHQYSLPEVQEGDAPANQDVTYGLDQMNATEVWDMGITGEGADVAILDTGVAGDHPDIDIAPERFVEIDEDGNPVDVDPYDSADHGTHVSGTATGSANPDGGTAYGVAPDATLWHGLTIPGGGGSFVQVAGGMEWAANQSEIDVVGMSLGAEGYLPDLIEAAENIRESGKILTASIGNAGQDTSGSPGNYYSSFASGAVDSDGNLAGFSSGETINTQEDFGDDAPNYWPDEYVQPNAAAAGVDVLSAAPDGSTQSLSGTSMSQPHKAGLMALMTSAYGDVNPDLFKDVVQETAWQPDDSLEDPNQQFGHGIVDAAAAVGQVAYNQSIEGTVYDTEGNPVAGAEVTVDETGVSTMTGEDGTYSIIHEAGTWSVTADAFGHSPMTETVELNENETATQEFDLDGELDLEPVEGQQEGVEAGSMVTATVNIANVDTVTVNEIAGYEGNMTLHVGGEEATFGEPVSVDYNGWSTVVEIAVETESDVAGEIELEHTFAGAGDSTTITTGPTTVFEEYVKVGVVGENGDDVVNRLSSQLGSMYTFDTLTSSEAVDAASNAEYDVYAINSMEENHVEEFNGYTAGATAGVVWLDNWGSSSNGIEAKSAVLGNPSSTSDSFSSPNPELEITSDHPIFEGVGQVGDMFQIHSASFADHSWFEGYDGDVIGNIQAGGVDDGSGVGVDEEDNTILLSTFGSSSFVSSGDFSEEADMVLANAVSYLSEESDVEPEATLSIEDTNVSVQHAEDEVTLHATHESAAGFQAFINFDTEAVEITNVEAANMGIQYELNNDEGWLYISGAEATGQENPELAHISLNASGLDASEETALELGSDSVVNDEMGNQLLTTLENGHINAISQELGDVLGDGDIHSGDAVVVQRYIAGLDIPVSEEMVETYGDVDQDGEVTSADVTAILQHITEPDHPGFAPDEDSDVQSMTMVVQGPQIGLAG
ncbi:S8 family serine peptidase [Halovenus rubra]|uniref:S8 family serine peptidase n=2 Tax=Halovenus rubra TaxID=869890 RepID=A0ACC7DY75_9EURY|nr:S8 family serine peptidase [Halovenus rubra]